MEIHKSDECSCNKCGKCCSAFLLSSDIKEHTYEDDEKYHNWVHKYIEPISYAEAEEILEGVIFTEKHMSSIGRRFYRCKALGPDNLCTIYDERPITCSGYPFYENEVIDVRELLYKKCGYAEITHKEKETRE